MKAEEITLKTEDGVHIYADHYKNGFDRVIIVCPGFLMHKDARPFKQLSEGLSKEFDVITMDFRGHGKSKGSYTFTSRENLDLRALIDFAKRGYASIGVIGFSLGGAVAINEISECRIINKLMVVSAPADFYWIENRFLTKGVIASTLKKFDWKMGRVRLGNVLLKKPRPIENVTKLSPIPILFVHGEKDTIVKPRHSRFLYERAREPKRIVTYKDCLHAEDIFFGDNYENFVALCADWFKEGPS
jgi:alpha-beta hydrolase superfamily lysophospholipase